MKGGRSHVTQCKKCGIEKTLENTRRSKGYFLARCRKCDKEFRRAYSDSHREEIALRRLTYRQDHSDEIAEKKRAYYLKNKQSIEEKAKPRRAARKPQKAAYDKVYRKINEIRIKASKLGYSSSHKTEKREYDNIFKKTESYFDRRFRTTKSRFEKMNENQGGKCVICGRTHLDGRRLHIDHDHETGIIRGLLCVRCNMGLGLFQDSAEQLIAAAEYLVRHGEGRV